MDLRGLADVVPVVVAARDKGQGVAIVTVVANRSDLFVPPGNRVVVLEGGDQVGQIHEFLDPLLFHEASAALIDRRSRFASYHFTSAGAQKVGAQGGNVDVFFEVLNRPPRLIIVGAGHIAVPLARMAKLLDFEVIVLDDRVAFANRDRFPEADQILVGAYAETLAGIQVNADTYIVLVTRGHVHDQACLEQVIDSSAAYIGMIGSKRRVRTVAQHARERGVDAEKLERVYAPVGLAIGSQTPAEIALAILAEIVNIIRHGNAPSLALKEKLGV